jgi:orotidine-5'-phosphate decarboxylase
MPTSDRLNPTFSTAKSPLRSPEIDKVPLAGKIEAARQRLIVALDVPTAAASQELVNRLEGTCQWFKVGLELFTAAGAAVIEPLIARGHSVFLDLKFHDIPNTVAGAVRSAATLGVRMMNVHAAGGPAMLVAAREALQCVANPPELLAVTVLTSMDAAALRAAGLDRSPAHQVELLANMCLAAGIRGFVCSPQEVATLRSLTGPSGILVVPGIRPAGANPAGPNIDDQKRIATPAYALQQGASFLVVGRPITQAPNPAQAAEVILAEMAEALPS